MRLQAPLLARMRAAITKAAVQALGVRDLFGNPAERLPGGWQRGLQLEPIGALTAFGAVWACNTRIANDIGKLEPLLLQRQSDGTWQRAPDASPYWLPLLWVSAGFLWSVWLMQNAANIAVYLPRDLRRATVSPCLLV